MEEENKLQPVDSDHELPLLPLKDIVIFPHMIVPVFISEEICINAVEYALANQRKIFLSAFNAPLVVNPFAADTLAEAVEKAQANTTVDEGLRTSLEAPFDVYDVGTVCSIMRTRKLPDGRIKILIQGLSKASINTLVKSEPFPVVKINPIQEPSIVSNSPEVLALVRIIRENLEKVVSMGKTLSPDILMILEDVSDPGRLSDLVAANLGLKVQEAQSILAILSPIERLKKVHNYLSREIEVYQMQLRIQSQAKDEIGRMQKEHYLREQMRVIRTELGDSDGKDEIDALWKKAEEVKLTAEAKEELSRQLKRLERMHQDTSEAALTRTHIETILSLPWQISSKDNLQLKDVKKVLDEDHYGLEQVKDRIIEYLAVKKLNPGAKSPIICFVGPPGVGKTSLGKSVARAMGRSFSRISLGGVRDEADIRGHRRTYVGAFPGRVIQAIKAASTDNPLIMLDEIDKVGSDHRGDPASALLEVLDPEQNKNFVDHYLGVAFDLSKVFFIANANRLDTIDHALRDRLEIIELSGYHEEEKLAIATQYLIPKQLKETGLSNAHVVFSRNSLTTIINNYTRESGLRSLEKQIASICRKIARQYAESDCDAESTNDAEDKKSVIKLTPHTVQRHLGAQKYNSEFYYNELTLGVALGMAYTPQGGEVMAIEANLLASSSPKLVLTGQLGDVMKESAQAALSHIRSKCKEYGVSPEKLEKNEIHIHVPAGAVPKDGPSAGITLATAILSVLLGKAPSQKIAMTGEITLHGKILPIGGLKEKTLAALREGIEHVIVPERNRPNFEELPVFLKKRIKVTFASEYDEVFEIMFERTHKNVKTTKDTAVTKLAS